MERREVRPGVLRLSEKDHYPEASAGGNMVCRVPVAKPADLAGEVIKGLQGEEGNTCNIA